MRLGLSVGYWGLGLTAEEQLALVREAESLGFDSVWAAEAYGSDAATVLAWLAAQTERIKLGSAIFQMPGAHARDDRDDRRHARPPLERPHAARHRLVGPAGGRGLARAALRQASWPARASTSRSCARRSRASGVEFDGETYTLPLPDGPGKALKLMIAPVQERIPIYIAAIGPKNTQLAGEIADGWMPTFFSPEHVGEFARAARGGRRRGRAGTIDDSLRHRAEREHVHRRRRGRARATRCGRSSRCTSAAWARASRTSTTRWCAATGSRRPPTRCRTCTWTARRTRPRPRCPAELIDIDRRSCGPAERIAERLEVYRDAGRRARSIITPMAFDARGARRR